MMANQSNRNKRTEAVQKHQAVLVATHVKMLVMIVYSVERGVCQQTKRNQQANNDDLLATKERKTCLAHEPLFCCSRWMPFRSARMKASSSTDPEVHSRLFSFRARKEN
jgi:hypothetical protein